MKLIVFDMAGTTVFDENKVGITLQAALQKHGYDLSVEEINVVMGYEKPVAISLLLKENGVTAEKDLVNKIHQDFVEMMIEYYTKSDEVRSTPNAHHVMQYLRENGIYVAFDTGFSRPIADTIFKRLDWKQGQDFDFSITSDEVENGRPYPDMIFKAMEHFNITDSKEVGKIGDTMSDLQQGENAKCGLTIGVTSGAYSRNELKDHHHDYIIDDLLELKNILKN
ncbi:HAD hydrolase-like protein [Chryseobacterium sp. LC2016-27]|uniref:HAD hydrolase-like protein n=1 Tax=Chryseobacterium sp. LC2016-27 TaxID=2897326 RepID=UPI001E5050F6|nr:HAD hydrolase-like protein [Chryseobacterium sp. LC2016-27]MCD0457639.1 HAD hydrolase-like protein [Chryseobacterium sp. LC2016-27]